MMRKWRVRQHRFLVRIVWKTMSAFNFAIHDRYYRMRQHTTFRDTVGTIQSAQSLTRMLGLVVYQRPALMLYVEIITLLGFATGMLIMGKLKDIITYGGQTGRMYY
ncbi:hypothetical protein NW765_001592 [Fusarium oxysporum]|nr:hypothetical protein NW765_001592 [Fusarium oxysporum]KAJ4283736.1 hypothetical protein NW764_001294 [Fusarium oxysporum]